MFFTRNTLSPFWLVVVYIAWMWRDATRKLTFNKEKDRSNKCEVFGFSNWRLLENLNVKILGDHKINVGSESIDSASKIFFGFRSQWPIFVTYWICFLPGGRNSKKKWIRIYIEFGTDLIPVIFKYVFFSLN